MVTQRSFLGAVALGVSLVCVSGCGSVVTPASARGNASALVAGGSLSYAATAQSALANYTLTGANGRVHDPSMMRQGGTYYVFSSDFLGQGAGFLHIRCSQDMMAWTQCGSIFNAMPQWIAQSVPGALCLWAPDVSYFNGQYHVYYAASTAGSQVSAIGLVTNVTLDATDPRYKWADQGPVLTSKTGDDFNAIDPNVLVDTDGSVWLTYGSYWSGIKQREIDPTTGMLSTADPTRYDLATRPGVALDPIEGASLVRHGSYYYLFVSVDFCCEAALSEDNYKQAVGRSTGPHGPFVDTDGTEMMNGGGTVLLEGTSDWVAPGGGSGWTDPDTGEIVFVFHALNASANGAAELWVKKMQWKDDWPVLQ